MDVWLPGGGTECYSSDGCSTFAFGCFLVVRGRVEGCSAGRWERFEDYLRGYWTRGDMVGGLRDVGGCRELVGAATGW